MSPDTPDDDRTVIRPPGALPQTGFQKTEWSAAHAIPPAAPDMEKTQLVGAPPPLSPADDMAGNLPVGTRLGEFEITSLIGEGGFGIVYMAHDHSLQRRVALKEYMPSSLAARAGGSQVQVKSARHRETFEAGLKSFINEARLLASFDHPSLVKVYRFWEANGTAYMVMPFLQGTTLKDVLRSLPERPDEVWLRSVLGPLTEALLVIHAEQCYHRDIAPDNVMLLPKDNRWLLLDFGAARRVIGDMTQALTVILKPGYAPVEQYAEIPGMKQGPWTDVYALAAVVYFAIMGRTPPPSVGRLLNDTYVPLVQAAAGRYSEPFLSAIDRALAVRPEERTQSIGELRNDLGLGEAVFDSYATRPLPPGTEIPSRRTTEPTQVLGGGLPTAAFPPPPRPVAASPAPRAAAVAAPAEAPRKGSNAMVGVGIGVVVLGALGFGAYALLAPKSRPAAETTAAAPVPAPAPAPAVVPAPPPPVTGAAPAPAPATAATPTPPAVAAAAGGFDVMREFQRIVSGQKAGFGVRAEARKTQLKVGKDEFQFSVSSDREGYLYVFGYSPDGTLAQIVPNSMSGTVQLRKGQSWKFPTGDGFALDAQDPAGATELLIMVSARQRNHDALRPRSESHVRFFPTGPEAAALAAKYDGPNSILAGRALCPGTGPCDDEYGATVLHFETVR
jgi:serine/threonine protein kinase